MTLFYFIHLFFFVSYSGPSCSLSAALEYIGLSDIMLVVRLMQFCAAGKLDMFSTPLQMTEPSECLGYLSAAIGALAKENPLSLKQLVKVCAQVRNDFLSSRISYDCKRVYILFDKIALRSFSKSKIILLCYIVAKLIIS